MSWRNERILERQRIPQATATRNLPGLYHTLNQYGVQTRFQSDDLSVKVTALSTTGSLGGATEQHQRGMKLSSSDSKAIGILRQSSLDPPTTRGLKRGHTVDEMVVRDHLGTKLMPLPTLKTKKQLSVDFLPPILTSKTPVDSGVAQEATTEGSTFSDGDELATIVNKDSVTISSSEEEDLISDDDEDSSNEDMPQSALKFQDPSQSSFSSLAAVELTTLPNDSKPFVTTLIQERLLEDHERTITGVSPAGMSSVVNNVVRAYEIKGPLDKSLLESALVKVVKLHPILSAMFHRHNSKLYVHVPKDSNFMHLEVPLSYEKPQELITLARRKAFEISVINHEPSALQPNSKKQPMYFDFDDHMSVMSCSKDNSPQSVARHLSHNSNELQPSNLSKLPSLDTASFPPLIRAKLISNGSNDHVLLLSFSRVVCDYWSSCLFVQQLSHAYGQLERSQSYRPSLTVMKTINKRQETIKNLEQMRSKAGSRKNRMTEPRGRTLLGSQGAAQNHFQPICPPSAYFQQMALRERQLLLIRPKERLWTYWQSVITATIRRTRGPHRIKVIQPIRIPKGFGAITRTTGLARPTTARLRPLTARNRPQTARRGIGFGMDSLSNESLSGPVKGLHTIKVPDNICFNFLQSLPIEYSAKIEQKELLSLMCLGVYVLTLGVCSKGWGLSDVTSRHNHHGTGEDTATDAQIPAPDPLLKYNNGDIRLSQVLNDGSSGRRHSDSRKHMDIGSFLIGVDVSVRQLASELTQGLFGPLSNVVGMRVDLTSNPTFADLVLSLWISLQSARCHAHFPFNNVEDELGLVQGLPVQFSYFYPHDLQQLSNPEGFYFMETSVGVTGKALSRFGSSCYMNPLSTKMDDNTQLELLMWESVRGNGIDGIFLYQTQLLRPDIVEKFSNEMLNLLSRVSKEPTCLLKDLAASINPPYLHTASRMRR